MNTNQKKYEKQRLRLPVRIEHAVSKAYWSAIKKKKKKKNASDSQQMQINVRKMAFSIASCNQKRWF